MDADLAKLLQSAFLAARSGRSEDVFVELAGVADRIDRDAELAAAWLELLRATPNRPTLLEEADKVLARWPEDPGLVLRACDALLEAAQRVPPDDPTGPLEAARRVVRAAERCRAALPAGGDATRAAALASCRANGLRLLRDFDAALSAFRDLLDAHPERGGSWFDLGLLHKARGSFREGMEANRRARALLGDRKPVLWNLALCAIAVGEGGVAVEALRALGHEAKLSPSGMPYVEQLPPFQIRVATVGSGYGPASHLPDRSVSFEVVWVTPLSPCHGVVSSATFREASVDYGDLVLWDGVPVGVIEHEGRPVPRFPLLARLRKGDERRFRFLALQQHEGQVAALAQDLPQETRMFIHLERTEHLCARCASGDDMRKHEHGPAEPHRLVYGKLVASSAADLESLRRALEDRLRSHPGVQVVMPGLLEALGATAAAGKAHQLWRGLERSVAKHSS